MLKYIKAEKQATQYYFKVHMDDTKKQVDGTPDPAYVRDYIWGQPLVGQTETDYLINIKREIGLLVEDELKRMTTPPPAPTPLVGF